MHTRPYLVMNRLILDDAASAADTAYRTAPPLFAEWVSCGGFGRGFYPCFCPCFSVSALVFTAFKSMERQQRDGGR
ncbi:MAG: hypothetical protein ACRC5V_01995 [Aeromonas sp.]